MSYNRFNLKWFLIRELCQAHCCHLQSYEHMKATLEVFSLETLHKMFIVNVIREKQIKTRITMIK
jgi:hypothetical protein